MDYIKLRSLGLPLRLNDLKGPELATGINYYYIIYFYFSALFLYFITPYPSVREDSYWVYSTKPKSPDISEEEIQYTL